MSDLSHLLSPRSYPESLGLVRDSFAPQPDKWSCGAAIVRHGLLLGGLLAPVNLLESLLEIRNNKALDEPLLLEGLRRLGFEVEAHPRKKPENQRTADFLDGLRPELEQGAFLLSCLYDNMHWVCLGAWDGKRAWVVDSFYGTWVPRGMTPCLGFFGYTEQQFDKQRWGDEINVVRPGIWTKQYQDWLPARPLLLRMAVKGGPATLAAAARIAAVQYLDDAQYSYRKLDLYLSGGVGVAVKVKDPGKDAVSVVEEGVGEDMVLVVRRVSGTLTRQTPPELVLRASHLHAVQLS